MQRARPEVLRLMRENCQKGVMMILNCEMVKQNLINKNVEILNDHFQTSQIKNLNIVIKSEEFVNFLEAIQKKNFNQRGVAVIGGFKEFYRLIFIWSITTH